MFRLALSSHIYFLLFESPIVTVQGTELDIVNGAFCNLCALTLGWRYTDLRYTVLTSSNKSETATLSVLVMLVSRNVFPVVSAFQFIALIHRFRTRLQGGRVARASEGVQANYTDLGLVYKDGGLPEQARVYKQTFTSSLTLQPRTINARFHSKSVETIGKLTRVVGLTLPGVFTNEKR